MSYIDTYIHIGEDDIPEVSIRASDRRIIIDYDDAVIYMPIDKAQELLKKLKDALRLYKDNTISSKG